MTFKNKMKREPIAMNEASGSETRETGWKTLYITGGVAALLAVIVFRRNLSAELSVSDGFGIFSIPDPLPNSALEWFALLQNDPFVGLSLLNFFDLINFALVGLIFLALYGVLRKVNRGVMVMATSIGLVGVAVYLASNQAWEMFSLSQQYAEATTETRRSILLTAGDVLLATNHPEAPYQATGIHVGLFLVLVAGLLISIVMLKSDIFHKAAAICGILANGLALLGFIALAFGPTISWIPPTLAAPFRMIWYILIAIKLLKLART
jgi:hypothetical protein